MTRKDMWTLSPSEEVTLAKSLAADLDGSAVLTGTPTITIYQWVAGAWVDSTSDFTVASQQVNSGALTTERGETIAIGEAAVFTLTAPATEGDYVVEVSCAADDGTTPKSNVSLKVTRQP